MKKLFIIPAAIFAVLFLISAIKISQTDNNKVNTKTRTNISSNQNTNEPKYILKEYQGGIAVFSPNSNTPQREYSDVLVKALPEYDRALLKNGIKVFSDKQLQQLIEDYDS